MTHIPDLDSLDDELAEINKRLLIDDHKKRARQYEQENDWANTLLSYREVLRHDPDDEEAQAGVSHSREKLMIHLYAEGEEQLEAEKWSAAVATFDRLLDEAKQAGLADYQKAQAKRQMALEKITPPPASSPTLSNRLPWIIAGVSGVVILILIVALILVLQRPAMQADETEEPGVAIIPTDTPTPNLPTPEPTSTSLTLVPTPEISATQIMADSSPTIERVSDTPTSEPTVEVPTHQPATNTSTVQPIPTPEPTIETSPTQPITTTSTLEAVASDTATPEPLIVTLNPPAPTLTGKIAVPVFDPQADTYNVYIARAVEGWQPTLFLPDSSQPAFSPDGQAIILRTWPSTKHNLGQRLIFFPTLSTNVGNERLMTQNLEDAHPSLRGDGEIVFHTRREGPSVLFTLGTWDGAERSVDNQRKLGLGENPDWLGERIVYYAAEPTPGLYVRDIEGPPTLVFSEPGPFSVAAAPDGDRVAISLKRDGYWHIFTVSVSQGQSSLKQLTYDSVDDQLPVWSPDSQSIAFVSRRDGAWAVWVMNADGSNQRKLFDLSGPLDGKVAAAPDKSFGWGEERLSWGP